MAGGPRRRSDQKFAFMKEVMHPLWKLERMLQRRRSRAINRYARFVDGVLQTCPTYGVRAKPKIIFDTKERAARTQEEFARIGSDTAYPYPCSYGGDNHWHLGRDWREQAVEPE